jgi:hypothetical protein
LFTFNLELGMIKKRLKIRFSASFSVIYILEIFIV